MNLSQLNDLYAYNHWAQGKILVFLADLEPDQFTQNLGSSFPSLRDTLVHILSAEQLWLSRWQGEAVRGMLNPQDFPNIAIIKERWAEHEQSLQEFITTLSESALQQIITYKNIHGHLYSLELWKQMLHVVNHTTFHRGQLITMARQLALTPPSTDLIYYYLGER